MATKALRGTPRALYTYRTKPSSLSARRMLPRSAIASTRCASTFLSQKYPSKGGKLLDSLSAVTFAVCFFYAPLHGQNLQCAGPDDDAVAQFQKANSEAVAVFNEICKVIRLQPNEKIEVLPNEGAFVVRLESDAGQSDVVIPYTDFVNPDLPAGQPTLLAIWLQVPDGIDDFPDFVVPLLSAIFKRKDDSGQFAVPGHAAALTQWRNDLIVWEYDKGKLIEVKQFHPKVPQGETGRRLIEEFLSGQ